MVLDCFAGTGTTAAAALKLGRISVNCESELLCHTFVFYQRLFPLVKARLQCDKESAGSPSRPTMREIEDQAHSRCGSTVLDEEDILPPIPMNLLPVHIPPAVDLDAKARSEKFESEREFKTWRDSLEHAKAEIKLPQLDKGRQLINYLEIAESRISGAGMGVFFRPPELSFGDKQQLKKRKVLAAGTRLGRYWGQVIHSGMTHHLEYSGNSRLVRTTSTLLRCVNLLTQ